MKLNSLEDLMLEQLQDAYDAEHQILEAMPDIIKAASSQELKQAFQDHTEQTCNHIKRLEQIFEMIGRQPKFKTCNGMKGLIQESQEIISLDATADVKDAGLIATSQRIEHYEMAGYRALRTFAYQLEYYSAARLLQETLDEEELAAKSLTSLAGTINLEAVC